MHRVAGCTQFPPSVQGSWRVGHGEERLTPALLGFRSGRGFQPQLCPSLHPPHCCHAPRKEAVTR